MYLSNFWDFSKRLIKGELYKDAVHPAFTQEEANKYYTDKYSQDIAFDPSQLNWFPYIRMPRDYTNFDMSVIKPKHVKCILQQKSSTKAPGPDCVTYGFLKKLPATHHFLATLFTKILQSGTPCYSWSCCRVSLLYKKGEPSLPENFRMIALNSCIAKVYHQILAYRFCDYLTSNKLIDVTMQKAFIQGINGCIEHTQVMQEQTTKPFMLHGLT